MVAITNDILRLAGVPATLQIKKPVEDKPQCDSQISDAKYLIISAIEKYSNDCDRCVGINTKSVYRNIINKLDDIVGCLSNGNIQCAVSKFGELDSKVKRDIQVLDDCNVCDAVFKCAEKAEEPKIEEPKEETPEPKEDNSSEQTVSLPAAAIKITREDPEESKEKEEKETKSDKKSKKEVSEDLDYDYSELEAVLEAEEEPIHNEYDVEKVSVPRDVISDIKLKIKELDDGNNYQYTKHLKHAEADKLHYCHKRASLETILEYLTDANELSIRNCITFIQTLDSSLRQYIPSSVWKYLCVPQYVSDSIKNKLKQINIK